MFYLKHLLTNCLWLRVLNPYISEENVFYSLIFLRRRIANGVFWGRLDVKLSGAKWIFRCVEYLMNQRSRWTAIATGDQGIFVEREFFRRVGTYPPITLMEDIALSKQLRACSQPVCLKQQLSVSSRRWEQRGIAKTILLMWWLRFVYFLGANPNKLHRLYYSG